MRSTAPFAAATVPNIACATIALSSRSTSLPSAVMHMDRHLPEATQVRFVPFRDRHERTQSRRSVLDPHDATHVRRLEQPAHRSLRAAHGEVEAFLVATDEDPESGRIDERRLREIQHDLAPARRVAQTREVLAQLLDVREVEVADERHNGYIVLGA